MLIDHSNDTQIFLQAHLGGDRNFCYLMGDKDTGEAIAIDPGYDAPAMAKMASARGLRITNILITHEHPDHWNEAMLLHGLTGAPVWVGTGAGDKVGGARELVDEQTFPLGDAEVRALATPGHAPAHFCFLWHDYLVTGDLLFCGKIGGTGPYFPGSDAAQQYESLQRLLKLPEATRVFPGHDYYGGEGQRRSSTIGQEKADNPFLTAPDFQAFCHLKENWAEYKKEHGIK